ncbi:hypothetical protein WJX81_006611 [Elliptochloris bilobata]|uniref:Uncharacterized protein n=1 Tax=Elliptochloris bilobata TaxID=381761 RepID=A0AAW1REA0_9CHLO
MRHSFSARPAAAAGSLHLRARLKRRPAHVYPRGAPFGAIIPGDGVAEQVFTTGISSFLSLYNTAIIGRVLLTWFPNAPAFIQTPLATLCDPYLNLFRGLIPPLGGTIDLSPILAFIVLDLFQNTASALPAELGPDGGPPAAAHPYLNPSHRAGLASPSRAARAWAKRLAAGHCRRQAASKGASRAKA